MTQTTDAALVERLRKRAGEDRAVAENSAATLALLQPELDKFDAEQRFNTYVIRMAVDHKNSARKDGAYADDLTAAADTIEAQARRVEECADLLAAVVNADPGPKADAAFAAARAWYAAYDALDPTP